MDSITFLTQVAVPGVTQSPVALRHSRPCDDRARTGKAEQEAWLGVVRELASLVEAAQGVIWAGEDERPIVARQFLTGQLPAPDAAGPSPQ